MKKEDNFAPKKDKIALIFPGGGISACFGVGCASALKKMGIKADIIMGSSGNAPTATYLATNEPEIAERLWRNKISQSTVSIRGLMDHKLDLEFFKKLLHFSDAKKILHSIVHVEEIIADIESNPFNIKKLLQSETEVLLAATNFETGLPHFFSSKCHQNCHHKWLEIIKASMAIPFFWGKTVKIDGTRYIDGDVSTTDFHYFNTAKVKGATKVILCENRNDISKEMYLEGIEALVTNKKLRTVLFAMVEQLIAQKISPDPGYTDDMEIIVVKPNEILPSGTFNNTFEAIDYGIKLGKKRVIENKKIQSLLEKIKN